MHSILCVFLLFITSINGQGLFDINDLDWSTRPTDNFFMFVNGRWINRTTIPSSETAWGGLYTMKYENTYKLKRILDDLVRHEKAEELYPIDSIERKLTDFYLAGLDEQAREYTGLEPLKQTLIQLHNVQTYQELIEFILNWYIKMNKGLIFDFEVCADDRNSSINMVHWKQTGTELPERNYYFRNDANSKKIRRHYITYIDRLLTLSNDILNVTTDSTDAEDIFSLETQLAVSHRTPYELRDAELNYNKYTITQLNDMMPNLDWYKILSILTIENQTVIMTQPDYYRLLDKLIVSESLDIWKNKIRFTILHEMSKYLNKDFIEARFHMFEHIIYGQHVDKTLAINIIEKIDKHLGELLGQLYVSRYFPSEARERTINLVRNLIDAYYERIDNIHWLNNITKEKALKKLETLNIKIGYPSKWRSYDDIFIDRSSYFNSISSILQHDYRKKIEDLKRLVDRDEWEFSPQTVNAFYYAPLNEIMFPAAVLQEPLFSFFADDALNYGAIGYVIGHELMHCLDDQGRKYDENGNLHSWWTANDIHEFKSRTKILVEQYNNYEILNTTVNGELTLGENIADLSGLEIAYHAFLRTNQAKENILIDGFTPKERFFLAFARTWRVKLTNEKILLYTKIDPHAPVNYRINGPLSNMMGFYETFNVTRNDAMFREINDRVLIW
ncbi:unnamed protein product [Adineta steineri]|uniref:Uncharacterized protein n=1 Tax=Adineta steineri TaxID=433720 RepID=A0A819C9Z5_9BILA|nr:unnamed protein product [Adineta steineri]CAF3804378.1 unnamed protein product [Adineta steineri]